MDNEWVGVWVDGCLPDLLNESQLIILKVQSNPESILSNQEIFYNKNDFGIFGFLLKVEQLLFM